MISSLIGSFLGIVLGIVALSWFLSGCFMWVAAHMAGVPNVTFGRSLLAALGATFATWLCAGVFSIIPIIGTVVGMVLGTLLAWFVIKGVFKTTFGRAFLIWVFNIFAHVAAVIVAILTFAGGLAAALSRALS